MISSAYAATCCKKSLFKFFLHIWSLGNKLLVISITNKWESCHPGASFNFGEPADFCESEDFGEIVDNVDSHESDDCGDYADSEEYNDW